jgi:hypothetical protein
MDGLAGSLLMAAITIPCSYFVARGCLRGLVRVLNRRENRNMLSSQP